MGDVLNLPATCSVASCGRRGGIVVLWPTHVHPVRYCGYHARPHLKFRILDQEDDHDPFDAD